ncbi:iron complex outermembrane receptor protein [Methylobacterium sp. PvP062]|uniref:Iron complex outermembrane receptor protein n=1 Tax=Methylobacterium radiotolerans TaxID=31998 RepID=A0ABV2NU66_9HYPH|nr:MULTISPECIES: TonB-dependent siderophore receptor [unclassified Methylobacterium]MBP2498314.1 iron complex outermembrane receptor protein [Methylobacterium sp. PvP105]MBP2505698.1 iron complex outermembrane receptor protein [Methylobacterium sp. PvP109]
MSKFPTSCREARSPLFLVGGALVSLQVSATHAAPASHPLVQSAEIQLDALSVEGSGLSTTGASVGYAPTVTSTGTKTATPIGQTPQFITVVPRAQIETQASVTVNQALRYEPGLAAETRGGNRSDSVFVRGFGGFGGNANYVQFLDNLRLPKGVSYAIPSVEPYLLERIDVIHGPASVLYGQSNPGGLINLVSKRPLSMPYNEVFTRLGSYGHVEGGFDLSGPVDPEGHLLYRLIGLGRDTDNAVKDSADQRAMIAPMLTWRPDASTTLSIQGLHQRDPNSFQSNWMPALGTLLRNPNGQIPYTFQSGNPLYNSFNREQSAFSYQFEHVFDDTFAVRQNFRYFHLDTDFKAFSVPASGSAFAAGSLCGGRTNLCLARTPQHYIESLDSIALDNEAEAHFWTGPLKHTVLTGLGYLWTGPTARYGTGTTSYVNYLTSAYGAFTVPGLTTEQRQDNSQLGLYAEDQIQFENWHLQAGVRHDWARNWAETTTLATAKSTIARTDSQATTGRVGLLYQFENGIAPFADYATSFEPQAGTGYGGTAFKPTTGEQYEAGVKYQPPGVDALVQVAAFDLTQFNVLTTDNVHTSTNTTLTGCSSTVCQVQTGAVNSKGVEFSAKASPLPGLALIASYGYADVKVTRSTVVTSGIAVQGKRPIGVPDQTIAGWGDYTIQTGALRGFGFGGGLRYIGSSFGDAVNSAAYRVPGYLLADAQFHYDFGAANPALRGLTAAVNATNLFDKHYVSACASANQCFYGSSRTVLATISYRW